jgi:HEAT repeat protein
VAEAVAAFLDSVGEILDTEFEADDEDTGSLVAALEAVADAVADADLDPDEDDEAIAALLEATGELSGALEAAEEWDDLTVVQKLRAQGFYDRLTPKNRKDYPPELSVVRIAEAENDPERVLMALDYLTSDFMQENCVNALKRMGSPEAYDEMMSRAQKRNQDAIAVLGKIGNPDALETLHDYIEGDSNPPLQKVTLRTIGEIGSEESTQRVADRLVAEDADVRSAAATALGLIGDTRAVEPLADVLSDDEDDSVRAAAARALNAIGTERALDEAATYAGDRSYIVQAEAERASEALGTESTPEPEPTA